MRFFTTAILLAAAASATLAQSIPPPGSGSQFITGPCAVDDECASGCCEPTQLKCRAPLSLKPNVEFCGNGFTPNFDGGAVTSPASDGNAGNNTPPTGQGTQFITGPCNADSDCASGCCEINQKKCRAPLSLSEGVEFCGNGFTPNFNGGAAKVSPVTEDNGDEQQADTIDTPVAGTGKQFITGPCTSDSDCASACCEPSQLKCRAPLSLNPGTEFCGNGFTPNFNGGSSSPATSPVANGGNADAPVAGGGTQFITGPCTADSDCASACCEKNQKKCRAPLSLKSNVEFCGNGFTTNFGK